MKNRTVYKLEEYKYIQQEIVTHQRLVFQVFVISVIASLSIFGYYLGNYVSVENTENLTNLIPIFPLAVIIPSALIITRIREDIFRWGAYIQVFFENEEPAYETRLSIIRDNRSNSFKESYTPIFCIWWILVILSLLFYLHAFATKCFTPWTFNFIIMGIVSVLGIISIVLFVITTKRYNNITKKEYRQKLIHEWQDISN